jgi:tetratricopeptide (TPR) repeat protein
MDAAAAERTGSLGEALVNAQRLLRVDAVLAEEQAAEILKIAPEHSGAHFVLGMSLAHQGRHEKAVAALRRAAELDHKGPAWRALGDQYTLLEDHTAADAAYAQSIHASVNEPELMEAAVALCEDKLAVAEHGLRHYLRKRPTDVAAIRMLAEVGARLGRFEDSEKLLARCLQLAPSFHAARHNYAIVLHRESKSAEALKHLDVLLEADPKIQVTNFCARRRWRVLANTMRRSRSIAKYWRRIPNSSRAWLSLGHACKTAGLRTESIAAYERVIADAPSFGEAYWSLANMKTHAFSDDDVARMNEQLARRDLGDEDRFHIHYALGKALEDKGAYERSFTHYAEGARIRRTGLSYKADETTQAAREHAGLFTRAFFDTRKDQGSPAPDPIFIVGLPRSGSTLIEQILASHSMVEGTMELPDVIAMAKRLGGGKVRGAAYPGALAQLSPEEIKALGEEYLARTRVQRKTDRPFFIDKMPNNCQHVGFIHLILPNAKIIDARRHPIGACFSAFKQHFARGQAYTYDLSDVGRYYADYAELMARFDEAAPGRVHRVLYEDVIENTEAEVRRLLAYLGLPFERACLEFHANARAVRTASSEQVRQPIYSGAVEQWRHYEPWLQPLKEALGQTLERYSSR